jgi:hypothetical protein
VYVRVSFVCIVLSALVFTMRTSADALTVVLEAVEVLFEATGSYVVAVTVPVLVRVPGAFAVTTIVTVAEAPLASVPIVPVTTPPDWLTLP